MTEPPRIHRVLVLLSLGWVLGLGACSDTLATLNNLPPNPGATCDAVDEKRDDLCPEVDIPCEAKSTAECIFGTGDEAFESLCYVERTGNICQGADISPDYERWCALQFCQGADFDECLNDGLAQCVTNPTCGSAPPTCVTTQDGLAPNPEYDVWCSSSCVSNSVLCRNQVDCQVPVGDLCDQVEALVGSCPDYGYQCRTRPTTEVECLLAMWQSLPNPCIVFLPLEPLARCGVGSLSAYGDAMCQLESCLETGFTWSYDECNFTYASICGFIIP